MTKNTITAAAIAASIAVSFFAASAAQAAPDCEAASFTFSSCAGSYTLGRGQNDVTNGGANDLATQLLNDDDIFGALDWTFGAKYDGKRSGDASTGFSVAGLNQTSGSFGFSNIDLATTDLAVSLKSAQGFSLYYFAAGTIADASAIAWDTAGTSTNSKGTAQALSHLSYYTRIAKPPTVAKVPEPAAMAGLLAVGMAAVLQRRRHH